MTDITIDPRLILAAIIVPFLVCVGLIITLICANFRLQKKYDGRTKVLAWAVQQLIDMSFWHQTNQVDINRLSAVRTEMEIIKEQLD